MSGITYQQFFNDYQILQLIGKGKCADVYRVRNIYTDEQYALKILFLKNAFQLTCAMNQIEVVSAMNDECIAKIYHHFIHIGGKNNSKPSKPFGNDLNFIDFSSNQPLSKHSIKYCLLMEICERSLADQIRQIKKRNAIYNSKQLQHFLKSMVGVLSMMQQKNFLHRDIKPQNILIKTIDGEKIYKLCDFGFSAKKSIYSDKSVCGTKNYMSPRLQKKFRNFEQNVAGMTAKDDVFSLGKTILKMLTLQNIPNEKINEQMFSLLKSKYDQNIIIILKKMLEIKQQSRVDFKQIKIQIKNFKQFPQTISSTNQLKKEEPQNVQEFFSMKWSSLKENQNQVKLIKKECSFKSQVHTIHRFGNYLILGVNNAIGVIEIQRYEQQPIALKLYFQNEIHFKTGKIITSKNDIIIAGSQKILYCSTENFLKQINYQFDNIRTSSKKMTVFGQNQNKKIVEKSIKIFNSYKSESKISCILVSQSKNIFLGHYNGSISISIIKNENKNENVNENKYKKQYIIFQDKSPIVKIEVQKSNLYYCTAQGALKRLQWKYSQLQNKIIVNNQTILCYEAQNTIISFQFCSKQKKNESGKKKSFQNKENTKKMTPFLSIFTYQGNKITLNAYFNEIKKQVIFYDKLLGYCQAKCIWQIKQQIAEGYLASKTLSSAFLACQQINKAYAVTKMGEILNLANKEILCRLQIAMPSGIYIDQDIIAVCNFNGQVIMLLNATISKKNKISNQQQRIPTQKSIKSIKKQSNMINQKKQQKKKKIKIHQVKGDEMQINMDNKKGQVNNQCFNRC